MFSTVQTSSSPVTPQPTRPSQPLQNLGTEAPDIETLETSIDRSSTWWPSTLLLGGEFFMGDRSDERPVSDVAPDDVAAAMWRDDSASQALGMQIEEVRLGYSRISMPVRPDMLNGHGVCHGGMIFTLADSAFAYATNAGNQVTLASGAGIDFLAPARLGELLVAEAIEQWTGGRTGITDVGVTGAGGRRIAVFRGRGTRVGGSIV
jgi:acyl-CoA thioesterase